MGLLGLSDPAEHAEDTELIATIGFIVESAYQKHQAMAEQRALGARYNALVEALPSGIGILNIRHGRIQNAFVNEAYAAILGDTPSIAAANFRHGPLHYVYEDDRNDFLQALQPLLAGKVDRIQASYRLKRADGSLHPVQEIFTAQPNEDQSLTVSIVSTDMSGAGQPSAEERYRLALEAASLSIWDYDIQKHCVIHAPDSEGKVKIVHNVPDTYVEDGSVHPDHVQAYLDMYHRLQSGEPQVEGVFRMLNDDRSAYRYEHIRYICMPSEDGKPHMAVGLSQDVTEKFAAQHNYARELQLQQMLVADMYATILLDVTNWQILRFQCRDPRFAEALQGKDPEAIFQNAAASVAGDEAVRERFSSLSRESILEMYSKGQHTLTLEYQRILPGDEVRWVEEDVRLLADPDSGHLMMFMQVKDVDSEKRRLDALSLAAETDSMTGFYNHDATLRRIRDFISGDGYHGHHALFMIEPSMTNWATARATKPSRRSRRSSACCSATPICSGASAAMSSSCS
jgi:PAS domain-containing protein